MHISQTWGDLNPSICSEGPRETRQSTRTKNSKSVTPITNAVKDKNLFREQPILGIARVATDAARVRGLFKSVAAGVGLVRDEYQTWACRSRFGAGRLTESGQDPENCNVGGQDADADGGDDGKAEDDRHQKRNHGLKILLDVSMKLATPNRVSSDRRSCNLSR